jgi:ABC-2 type transport system ATP-binding protein
MDFAAPGVSGVDRQVIRRRCRDGRPELRGPAMSAVSVRRLTKRFGGVRAVEDLTFDVPEGQVTGFLGANGAGKTTTLRMMVGLVRPTSGQVLIDGLRYDQLRQPRRTVGAVLEATGFHPGRRGRDHLRIIGQLAGVPRTRVDEILDTVDLSDAADRRVGGYSLGMRQRLGLAAALLGQPRVLVLDEPGNGLDPAGMAWLRSLLRDLAGQGCAIVVSSHVLAELAQTIDRVLIINAGRLRFSGPLAELTQTGTSLEAAFLRLTEPQAGQVPAGIDTRSAQ